MTTTHTSPTTETLVVIPTSAPATGEIPTKARHTRQLVIGGLVAAVVVAGTTAGIYALTRDDAPPAATTPTVVGSIEDNSAVVHGGAGQLMTVDGTPVDANGTDSTATDAGSIEDNSAVVHGGAGQLMTVDGTPVSPTSGAASTGTSTGADNNNPTTDPSIAHGSGDDVVSSTGLVHG